MAARLTGKVGIVTGAAHGMGASHAVALALAGADVAVTDIGQDVPEVPYAMGTETEMDTVVKEIQDSGRRAIGIRCDVSNAKDVDNMVQRVVDEFGKIDILVNNAGIAIVATPVWEYTEEAWDKTVDIMLKGTFLCCKYVLPHMIKQKYGKIVNIGSPGARAQRHNAPYCAAKAGIHLLTLAMAKDVGEYNINVNCVAPGAVYTPMLAGALEDLGPDRGFPEGEAYETLCETFQILGREITTEDVSNAVLFLCSEEARNVNGQVLYVDGGFKNI